MLDEVTPVCATLAGTLGACDVHACRRRGEDDCPGRAVARAVIGLDSDPVTRPARERRRDVAGGGRSRRADADAVAVHGVAGHADPVGRALPGDRHARRGRGDHLESAGFRRGDLSAAAIRLRASLRFGHQAPSAVPEPTMRSAAISAIRPINAVRRERQSTLRTAADRNVVGVGDHCGFLRSRVSPARSQRSTGAWRRPRRATRTSGSPPAAVRRDGLLAATGPGVGAAARRRALGRCARRL